MALWMVGPAHALDTAGPRINLPAAADAFGGGTGVVVGILDNGVDVLHPALAGNDSLGQPRLIAQDDFATDNWNRPDDTTGHGTAVAGLALSADPTFRAAGFDARFVNARVSDVNLTSTTATVVTGLDFARVHGATVYNLSLNESAGGSSNGAALLTRAVDYYASGHDATVVVSAGNFGLFTTAFRPTSPGDGFNVITAGGTVGPDYDHVWNESAYGPTFDNRSKPDIVAPATDLDAPNRFWEAGPDYVTRTGTSYSTPLVTGLLAAQKGYGDAHGLSTDPRVLKATLLNSAQKLGFNGQPWTPGSSVTVNGVFETTRPLDLRSGAGQADAAALVTQYAAGEQDPGAPGSSEGVGLIGWDLGTAGAASVIDYLLPALDGPAAALTVTLTWFRHLSRLDDGNGVEDANDSFVTLAPLADFDLEVLRNGLVVARSVAPADSVEHLHLTALEPGAYTLRVKRGSVGGLADESYALAWRLTPHRVIPEPSPAAALLLVVLSWRSKRPGGRSRSSIRSRRRSRGSSEIAGWNRWRRNRSGGVGSEERRRASAGGPASGSGARAGVVEFRGRTRAVGGVKPSLGCVIIQAIWPFERWISPAATANRASDAGSGIGVWVKETVSWSKAR